MHPLLAGKDRLVMTVKAEFRRRGNEEFFIRAAMNEMAGGAHAACNRGMDRFVLKLRLVMTVKAEIRHRCNEQFWIV